jgi:hypothetical protein
VDGGLDAASRGEEGERQTCAPAANGNCLLGWTSTSNGVIRAHWDLIDDHGNRCTNESIDSVFQVTLPGSGRSQTLKGP